MHTVSLQYSFLFVFFFNDTAPTEIYTLSLHDALPIFRVKFTTQNVIAHVDLFGERIDAVEQESAEIQHGTGDPFNAKQIIDRKSTRLNSSHVRISYAVFCLKKKKKKQTTGYHDTLTNH